MIKAIIFDCWDTLFYDAIIPKPFNRFAEKLKKSMSDYTYLKIFEKKFMLERCNNIEEAVNNLLKDLKIKLDKNSIKELVNFLTKKAVNYIKPFPETLETLNKLKKRFKLVLLTNAFSPSSDALEEKYNIRELFDIIVLSFEVGLLKPDPKMFEIALKKLGLRKNEVLMVGNSLKDDVEAAESFGIKGILLDRKGKHPKYPNRIKSLEELNKFL